MTTKEKKHNRNRVQYRFGRYKQPSEHHGHPVFIKYKRTKEPTRSHTDGYTPTPDNHYIVGHVYILPTTYRRFLATLRRKATLVNSRRKQQLAHALSSRN